MLQPPRVRLLGVIAALCLLGVVASARQSPLPLPIGKSDAGQATSDTLAVYSFNATTAGVLSVVIQGNGDLALRVVDEDDQTVPDGSTDADRFGSVGTEQLLVTLTEPGTYRVQVRMQDSGTSKFQIGASWIPFPGLAQPADPDRRPAQARPLDIGKSFEDSLGMPAGDRRDWFVITPKTSGTLTVILRPVGDSKVDLTLEVFLDGEMSKPMAQSDQDLQGNPANESITIDVKAGQKVFVKVAGASGSTSGKYRISSSLIQ